MLEWHKVTCVAFNLAHVVTNALKSSSNVEIVSHLVASTKTARWKHEKKDTKI